LKNKGLTYGLLIVVGVVWYQVFIRVRSNIVGGDEAAVVQPVQATQQFMKRRESFELAANYRDPFTGRHSATEASVVSPDPGPGAMSAQPAAPRPPKPSPPPFIWPSIRYFGLVRETKSSTPLTVLSIDGEYYRLRQGERALDDILVKKTCRDSVVIQYQRRTKVFYKVNR
jgi:hypothetical protein